MVLLKFTSVPVSSPYGWRTLKKTGQRNLHEGADTANGSKYPHSAFGDGVVVASPQLVKHWKYGWFIRIKHADGIETSHHSLDKRALFQVGDRVQMGQIVGYAGMSAMAASGNHVHNALWLNGQHVDPLKYLKPGVVVDVALPGAQAPVAAPAATPASTLLPDKDHEMYVLRNQKDGGCYMVGRKRLVHLGTTKDLTAARKVFEYKDLDDHAFRLALIAFSVPYPAAVKGGNFEGA